MNISAAVGTAPDLLTSTPSSAGIPAAAAGDAAPQASRAAPTSRGHGAGRGREPGHGEFERALRDEMQSGDAADTTNRAERHTVDADAAASKCAARDEAGDDDGDDAPPDGKGLPPWLPVLPPIARQDAPPTTLAGSTGDPLAAATTATTTAADAATLPAALATDTDAEAAALPASSGTPAATDVLAEALVEPAATEPAALPALPNGRQLPAQARADGPPAQAAAWRESARFAPLPEAPVQPPPAVPNEVPAEIVQAGGARADAAAQRTLAGAGERRPAPPIATTAPDPELMPIDAPVEPLSRHAVAALLAIRDAVGPATVAPSPATDGTASAASLLAGAANSSSAVATAAPTSAPLQIPVAVGAPDWDRQLSDKVQVLVDQGLTNAQLKLSPAHLGPLEIRISLQNDQANVWFGTHSHATREALEAAAPRLRDALGAQGFANVGVSVDLQQQASRGQTAGQGGGSRYEPEFSFAAGAAPAGAEPSRIAPRGADRSRLDAFA
jgi:flagellar hook-length control protein FliK